MTAESLRWKRVGLIASAAIALLVLFLVARNPFIHTLAVKAYFTNAMGLKAGATVRLAGVDVGTVKVVRARPELKDAPVEVVMSLARTPDLQIPSDSTASLETAGVLGETFVEIDATRATGPPIAENTTLKTQPTSQLGAQILEKLQKLNEDLERKAHDCAKAQSDAQHQNDVTEHARAVKHEP
jgi:phospholipid/cholesterol/gamma-HCH transport system substrate-binding protein